MKMRPIPLNAGSSTPRESTKLGNGTVLVNRTGLHPLSNRQTLGRYLRDLASRRTFIFADARSKSFRNGSGTFLGKLWIFFDPLLQVALYALVFGVILNTSRGVDNFIGFLILGVIFFKYVTSGLTDGSTLIQRNRALISSFLFPRASLVFSSAIRQFFDNIIPLVIAVILAIFTQLGEPISSSLIMLVPLVALMFTFNLGMTFVVARLTAFIPDLKSLISTVVRALFFVSGVFFTVERFDEKPMIKLLVESNPLYRFLELTRGIVLSGSWGDLGDWLYVASWSLLVAGIGFIFFWQAEARYAGVK